VLFAGAPSKTDEWIQACFQGTESQLGAYPFPRASQYRMYINCCATAENGIPPGGSVTITLPLYSPLVTTVDPTKGDQLIDWWQGGGINVYKAPSTDTTPPTVLQNHWTADNPTNAVTPISNKPTCGTGCNLHFFTAPNSIPNWEPQQLVEYTLGAAPVNPKFKEQNQPYFLWVDNNVDYDVSNVNNVYMPAATEPFGNNLIGYIGSTSRIGDVNRAINAFLASGNPGYGWPSYVDQTSTTTPKATVPGKVPSALEIF
jgi:hypothetical protein